MQLVLLAVVVVWLALVWYTYADARRRLDDQLLIGSAVLASLLFPFLGTIVYMIVRPPEYLEDVRERELEMEAAAGAPAVARLPALPALRRGRRARLPALPALPAQASRHVRVVQPAARSRLDDLPLLRGRDPRRHAAAAQPPPARRTSRSRRAGASAADAAGYDDAPAEAAGYARAPRRAG